MSSLQSLQLDVLQLSPQLSTIGITVGISRGLYGSSTSTVSIQGEIVCFLLPTVNSKWLCTLCTSAVREINVCIRFTSSFDRFCFCKNHEPMASLNLLAITALNPQRPCKPLEEDVATKNGRSSDNICFFHIHRYRRTEGDEFID